MVLVRLFDIEGVGMIINYPSGVVYSNQTGGTSCLQPELEGCWVPFRTIYPITGKNQPDKILTDHFCGPKWRGNGATSGIDNEEADIIDSLLEDCRFSGVVKVDRSKLKDSHEAWVFLQILADDPEETFSGFNPYPRAAVLTWPNSD
jgi:Family of unknown function (DUF6210)